METKVLVTYASKYGATAAIAEKIAEILSQAGLKTEALPVNRVVNTKPYQAVVLGTALYIGRWRKDAVKFMQKHEEALAEQPVWIFASGPTGTEPITNTSEGWHISKKLQETLEHIAPIELKLFHGDIDLDKITSLEKWLIDRVKAPVGDFRQWEAIKAWAKDIAGQIKEKTLQTA